MMTTQPCTPPSDIHGDSSHESGTSVISMQRAAILAGLTDATTHNVADRLAALNRIEAEVRRLWAIEDAAVVVLDDFILHDNDGQWDFMQSAYADTTDPLTVDAERLAHSVRVVRTLLAAALATTAADANEAAQGSNHPDASPTGGHHE